MPKTNSELYTYHHYKFPSSVPTDGKTKSHDNQLTITVDNRKHIAHITLITDDPKKLEGLPSQAASSLVTQVEKELQIYARKIQKRCDPLNPVETGKQTLIDKCIQKIQALKGWERAIDPKDHRSHELLRNHLLTQIEEALLENRKLTNTFATGEGELNETLCNAKWIVKDHTFNSDHNISYRDQLDFRHVSTRDDKIVNFELGNILSMYEISPDSTRRINDYFSSSKKIPPFNRAALDRLFSFEGGFKKQALSPKERSDLLDRIGQNYQEIRDSYQWQNTTQKPSHTKNEIWRSQMHLGDPNDTRAYREAIRGAIDVISRNFELETGDLTGREIVPGNRFAKLKQFCIKKLKGLRATMDKLAEKPSTVAPEGTELTPLTGNKKIPTQADLLKILDDTEKSDYFMERAKARWALFCSWDPLATHPEIKKQGIRDKKIGREIIDKGHIQDKFIRRIITGRKISPEEKEGLNLKLKNLDLSELWLEENNSTETEQKIIDEKIRNILREYKIILPENSITTTHTKQLEKLHQIRENFSKIKNILIEQGHLGPEENLIVWIKDTLENYHLAQSDHPPTKPASFENPLSASLEALKDINNSLVRYGEENPMITTTALAAFLFGGASMLAPKLLEGVLIKLHAKGLIPAIGWSQNVITSNLGTDPYSVTLGGLAYFGGVIALANIDTCFKKAIDILSESPVDIAMFTAIILAMPYGLNVVSPTLGHSFEAGFSMPILIKQMRTMHSMYHAGYPSQGIGYKITAWLYKIYLLFKNTFILPIKEYITYRDSDKWNPNNWLFNWAVEIWPDKDSKGIKKYFRILFAVFIGFLALALPSFLVKLTFKENIFFEFGLTLFQKEGYSFLPEILKFKEHPDDFWYSPRVILNYFIYSVRNLLVLLAHVVAFIVKIVAFLISPFIPELFASKPFKKSIRKLFDTFKRAIGALLHFCLSLIKFLIETIPTYIYIVYRGVCKLISKLLGTVAEPGKMADVLWKGYERPLSISDYFLDENLGWRVSPNYGWGIFKNPWLLKNWLLNPEEYLNGWCGIIKFIAIIGLDILIIAFFFVKDIIRTPLLFLNDFLISPCLRGLVLLLDLTSRGLMLVFAVCFEFLDILMHFPKYLKISDTYTPGNLIKLIAEKFIDYTHKISFFFGGSKRSTISFINELEADIKDAFFFEKDDIDNEQQERVAGNMTYIAQSIATLPSRESKETSSGAKDGPESIRITAPSARFLKGTSTKTADSNTKRESKEKQENEFTLI